MDVLIFGLVFSGGLFQSAQVARHDEFYDCDGWTIRWNVGLAIHRNNQQYAGNMPKVSVYSETGGSLGWAENDFKVPITEGEDWAACVNGYGSHERAGYIALAADGKNDAVCLSMIAVTHPDGHVSTVTGDMAAQCGYATGYSIATIGHAQPRCMWIDGDYSYGNENGDGFMRGLSFHLPDFEPTPDRVKYYNSNLDTLCNSEPLMHRHHDFRMGSLIRVFDPVLDYGHKNLDEVYEHVRDPRWWGWSDVLRSDIPTPARRMLALLERTAEHFTALPSFVSGLLTRAPAATSIYDRFEGTIVRSNHTSQSAVTLCDTPSMYGPDFVSLQEQIFCDMKTRKKYPVCDSSNAEGQGTCFDLDENTLLPGPSGTETAGYSPFLVPPVVNTPVKAYRDVQNWD